MAEVSYVSSYLLVGAMWQLVAEELTISIVLSDTLHSETVLCHVFTRGGGEREREREREFQCSYSVADLCDEAWNGGIISSIKQLLFSLLYNVICNVTIV